MPAIRATLGTAPAPGSLYTDFFAGTPSLTGDLFVRVTSDCSWALTFLRSQPVGRVSDRDSEPVAPNG